MYEFDFNELKQIPTSNNFLQNLNNNTFNSNDKYNIYNDFNFNNIEGFIAKINE